MKKEYKKDAQLRLFEIVKQRIPKNENHVDIIGDLLGIKQEAVYRRLNVTTLLNFWEIQKIFEKFNISIDEVLSKDTKEGIKIHYYSVDFEDEELYKNYIDYIEKLPNLLKQQAYEVEIIFAAQDIPAFHVIKYPELAFFRYYLWYYVTQPGCKPYSEFCKSLEKEKITNIYNKINKVYTATPVIEIWTENTIDKILKQIEYYYEIGSVVNQDIVLLLLEQLKSLLVDLKLYAENGCQTSKGDTPYTLYICSVEMESNIMLVNKDNKYFASFKLFGCDTIQTDNIFLNSKAKKWIDGLITKSVLISGKGAFKERNNFFNTAECKIQKLLEKIKK